MILFMGLLLSGLLEFQEASSTTWMVLRFVFGCAVWFLLSQELKQANFIPVSLEMNLALAKPANKEDERLWDELNGAFSAELKKGMPVHYTGFDLDGVTAWFHFAGADAETIQAEVKRVLGERPLPADAHFVIRTDWTTSEERQVPLAA